MRVNIHDKYFWLVFGELVCGFTASIAYINRGWAGTDFQEHPESPGDYGEQGTGGNGTGVPRKRSAPTDSGYRYYYGDKTRLLKYGDDSVSTGEPRKDGDDLPSASVQKEVDSALIGIILPAAFPPTLFRVHAYMYRSSLGKAPYLTLMIINLCLYFGAGALVIAERGSAMVSFFCWATGTVLTADIIMKTYDQAQYQAQLARTNAEDDLVGSSATGTDGVKGQQKYHPSRVPMKRYHGGSFDDSYTSGSSSSS